MVYLFSWFWPSAIEFEVEFRFHYQVHKHTKYETRSAIDKAKKSHRQKLAEKLSKNHIRNVNQLCLFKFRLKTHLFQKAFDSLIWPQSLNAKQLII